MIELNKLEEYLKEKEIEYERYHYGDHDEQIVVYKKGKRVWDAVCSQFSYGGKHGLLEVMGKKITGDNDVIGHLTADEVIKLLERK